MLLTGTFKRAMDDKQRIAIPKKWRDAMTTEGKATVLYITPGTDGSLAIYTEEALSSLGEQLSQGSPTGQEVRAFSRLFYSRVESADLDSQGRIRVPPELATLGGLVRDVVLVGVRDHVELWETTRWDDYLARQQQDFDRLAEQAFQQQ